MKKIVSTLITSFALSTVALGNQGFDGTWTGTEKMEKSWGTASGHLDKSAEHALFIIARNGTLIGRLKGVCPGRFDNPANRNGVLYFSAGQNESYYSTRGYGQSIRGAKTEFELRLSDNGNTLISKIRITANSSHYVKSSQIEGEALITGVYHRTTLDQAALKDAQQEIQKEFNPKK